MEAKKIISLLKAGKPRKSFSRTLLETSVHNSFDVSDETTSESDYTKELSFPESIFLSEKVTKDIYNEQARLNHHL